MALRAQASATSLSHYATSRAPGVDPLYGSTSRDFCNSFWGPGDDGVNILFSRMRGATKTTDELRHFWNERAAIEEQYATRLAALSKIALGGDEIGELRNSLDILRLETEKQAASHTQLAAAVRSNLETPTSLMHAKQVNHRRNVQAAVEKKFKTKQTQESYVDKAKEKYDGDCLRIQSYTQQCATAQGKDLDRLQLKLRRAQQTVQANEKDFANFTQVLQDMMPGWEAEWKDFCDTCQDLEEDRLEFMKDTLWTYANEVSTLCVNDDMSCERIRTVLDQLEPERDVENFVSDYGTGNVISDPATFIPYNARDGSAPSEPMPVRRPATFTRITRRAAPTYHNQPGLQDTAEDLPHHQVVNGHEPASPESPTPSMWNRQPVVTQPQPPPQQQQQQQGYPGRGREDNNGASYSTQQLLNGPLGAPPSMTPPPAPQQPPPQPPYVPPPVATRSSSPRRNRVSGPLPTPGQQYRLEEQPPMPTPPPPPPMQETGGILFYVKALYDYTATIEEEFDFQAGDVIAVTATPDDGWWSGELLDEARREEGRHIFPSNFVCLF
ncbi:SH3 domain-containing protein [Lyophyllum atratum]|nr:SH3 domain-containing protein [Lyophyllum atratum]